MELSIFPLVHAALGGFFLNMMNLYEDSRRPKSKRTRKDLLYWVLFVFWPLAGAGLAYIYIASGYRIDGMLAFTTGLTAPTVLQTLMAKVAPIPEAKLERVEEADPIGT